MTTTQQTTSFTGLRMLDVRQQVAEAGGGMTNVIKHDAGRYTITTTDGREWDVALQTSGMWKGTC